MLGFLVVMIPVVGLAGLVVGENLSTAIVMIGIAFIMCFVASRKWLYFILSFLAFSGAAVFAIFFESFIDMDLMWADYSPILFFLFITVYRGADEGRSSESVKAGSGSPSGIPVAKTDSLPEPSVSGTGGILQ